MESNPGETDFCPNCMKNGVNQPIWPIATRGTYYGLPPTENIVEAVQSLWNENFWRRQIDR